MPLHAIIGTDESEVKRAAAELAARLRPPGEFGLDLIDGASENVDTAARALGATLDALRTLPFFGGHKLVWLKNANFFADTVTGRSQTVLDLVDPLARLLKAGLPPDVTFLLSATDIDRRRTFYKDLQKLADLQTFDRPDTSRPGWEDNLARLVAARARDTHALRFAPGALETFVRLVGADTRQIVGELEKLHLLLGPQRRDITPADLALMVPRTRESAIFDLGNALAKLDTPRSFRLLAQLLEQDESPIGILLVAIVPTLRNLLLTRDLLDRHRQPAPRAPQEFVAFLNKLPTADTAHLPRRKDGELSAYALGIAACEARRHSTPHLLRSLRHCLEANLRLVTTQLDPQLVLAELLTHILRPSATA